MCVHLTAIETKRSMVGEETTPARKNISKRTKVNILFDILRRIEIGTSCFFIVRQVMALFISTIRYRQTTILVAEIWHDEH